jgi:hypothetical protein
VQKFEGETTVHDILDDEHVLALDVLMDSKKKERKEHTCRRGVRPRKNTVASSTTRRGIGTKLRDQKKQKQKQFEGGQREQVFGEQNTNLAHIHDDAHNTRPSGATVAAQGHEINLPQEHQKRE